MSEKNFLVDKVAVILSVLSQLMKDFGCDM